MRIVFDTNVLVSALRSRRGASFALLQRVGGPEFELALSVPLVLEYEDVLLRRQSAIQLNPAEWDFRVPPPVIALLHHGHHAIPSWLMTAAL